MSIAASGLHAQRVRMEVLSSNLANISTTRGPDGGPYRRQAAVFRAVPVEEDNFQSVLDERRRLYGVEVEKVEPDNREPLMVYDPDHPDADSQGFVAMPNINLVEEMTDLMNAARSYEANLAALQTAKNMVQLALSLGH
jgi:flagellar basal-body rod protein FlgC